MLMEIKFILRHLDSLGYIDNSVDDPVPLDSSMRYFYHEHIKVKIDRAVESIGL